MTAQAKPRPAPITNRLLRRPEVEEITGLSTSVIYRQMTEGRFPRPRRIGSGENGAVGWLLSDIEQWMARLPLAEPLQSGRP